MECVPTASEDVVNVAIPDAVTPEPITKVPSLKVTVSPLGTVPLEK
jgi:hypothetical protein